MNFSVPTCEHGNNWNSCDICRPNLAPKATEGKCDAELEIEKGWYTKCVLPKGHLGEHGLAPTPSSEGTCGVELTIEKGLYTYCKLPKGHEGLHDPTPSSQ